MSSVPRVRSLPDVLDPQRQAVVGSEATLVVQGTVDAALRDMSTCTSR